MLRGDRAVAATLRKTVATGRTSALLAQMKRDTERKITVEDLLRLKRAERPQDEFWATFEAEIRSKQLSAIVSRRPWWDRFSWILAAVSRRQLSLGSAAAVALAFAGYRYVGAHQEAVA